MPATKRPSARLPRNFVPVHVWITPTQRKALKALSTRTRVPQQAHWREAIDDLLAKYKVADSLDTLLPPVRVSRSRSSKS